MSHEKTLYLGARGSALSTWQAKWVAKKLQEVHPTIRIETRIIRTRGDRVTDVPLPQIGGKGLFTAEIESALLTGNIDIAVHSQKDLPVEEHPELITAAILEREDPRDALISRNHLTLKQLPQNTCIGTSSTRRGAQLLFLRPDLKLIDIRGNVDTRIEKARNPEGPYDAVVIAYAGLKRLGRHDEVSEVFDKDHMLPAPAQGSLAVQCRRDSSVLSLLSAIHHEDSAWATLAERAFLKGLGGGCSLPVAAHATIETNKLLLRGAVLSVCGTAKIELEHSGALQEAELIGKYLAERAKQRGADRLLASI